MPISSEKPINGIKKARILDKEIRTYADVV